MLKKYIALFAIASLGAFGALQAGLSQTQALTLFVFAISILGSLFFWQFKLSFVFIGSGIFLMMGTVNLDQFIKYASLDVVIFLIAMMIIVGMMKDAGFFGWLLTLLLRVKNLTGTKLVIIVMLVSALFSALMGEVASIIVMVTTLLEICYLIEVSPVPLIITSVMATNIGSAATVLGNPVGVLIAARSGLSFTDFLMNALPVSLITLVVCMGMILFLYKNQIKEMTEKLKEYGGNTWFLQLIDLPPDRRTKISIGIFVVTIFLVSMHGQVEHWLNLEHNTMLIMFPVISAGVVMLYRHDRAKHYVEHEVEWVSLLFFLFLFGQAGVMHASGVAEFFADKIVHVVGPNVNLLSGVILFTSGIISSGLDNVVAVATYVPIIKSMGTEGFNINPLWWALLFGACFGGNITMIGSTANIVAIGLLEKKENVKISFVDWFKIGALIGVVTMIVAYGLVLLWAMILPQTQPMVMDATVVSAGAHY